MERRREPRFSSDQPARLTLLGEVDTRTEGGIDARIADASGRGMRLSTQSPVRANKTVKIETADCLILGEVCYCVPEAGGFAIGIEIEQVLAGLGDLARLRAQLLDDARRPVEVSIIS